MNKLRLSNDWFFHLILLLLCFIPVILSVVMTTNGVTSLLGSRQFNNICIFKMATGYKCPACGMTRSFIYMGHLDFINALKLNFAAALLFLFCIFQIPYRLARIFVANIRYQHILNVFQAVFLVVIGVADSVFFIGQFIR